MSELPRMLAWHLAPDEAVLLLQLINLGMLEVAGARDEENAKMQARLFHEASKMLRRMGPAEWHKLLNRIGDVTATVHGTEAIDTFLRARRPGS